MSDKEKLEVITHLNNIVDVIVPDDERTYIGIAGDIVEDDAGNGFDDWLDDLVCEIKSRFKK